MSSLLCGLSLVVASWGYSLAVVHGLLIAVTSPVEEHSLSGVRALAAVTHELSSRSTQALAVAHGPGCSEACGVLPIRGGTHVPCTGGWVLYHGASWEALKCNVFQQHFKVKRHR